VSPPPTVYPEPRPERVAPGQFPKLCRVCHVAVTAGGWASLTLLGHVMDDRGKLELRMHHCGTTLAVEVPLKECKR
jgi:hypothetical protein